MVISLSDGSFKSQCLSNSLKDRPIGRLAIPVKRTSLWPGWRKLMFISVASKPSSTSSSASVTMTSSFIFACENGCSPTPSGHGNGLGLKIVESIVERYDCLMEIERSEDAFKATAAIPTD